MKEERERERDGRDRVNIQLKDGAVLRRGLNSYLIRKAIIRGYIQGQRKLKMGAGFNLEGDGF